MRAETTDELIASTGINMFSELLGFLTAILAILVIRGIYNRQEEKHRQITSQ
jgi:uncharacterized membrane protein (DUF373 family)